MSRQSNWRVELGRRGFCYFQVQGTDEIRGFGNRGQEASRRGDVAPTYPLLLPGGAAAPGGPWRNDAPSPHSIAGVVCFPTFS